MISGHLNKVKKCTYHGVYRIVILIAQIVGSVMVIVMLIATHQNAFLIMGIVLTGPHQRHLHPLLPHHMLALRTALSMVRYPIAFLSLFALFPYSLDLLYIFHPIFSLFMIYTCILFEPLFHVPALYSTQEQHHLATVLQVAQHPG